MGVEGTDELTKTETEVARGGSRRWWLLLGAGVVVVAVVVGLVVFGQDEPAAPRASTPAPLALGAKPVWTADRLAGRTMTDNPAVTIRDDAALLRHHREFTVLDAATGQTRWSVTTPADGVGAEIPGLDGALWTTWLDGPLLLSHEGQAVVLTDYWYPPETGRESGVALLSAATGKVLWRKDIPHFDGLGAADGRTVLVAAVTGGLPGEADDPAALSTMALDLATGETRWQQTGVWPDAVSGDTVLGHRSAKRRVSLADDTAVVGLDPATGKQKWDLSTRLEKSRLVQAAGDVAVVEGPAAGNLEVVTTESGARLRAISGDQCDTDGRTLIACAVPAAKRGDLYSLDIARHTVTKSRVPFLEVSVVGPNRVFLEDFDGSGYSVDRTGATVDRGLPGVLIAISDRYAMFDIPDEDRTEVYRLAG